MECTESFFDQDKLKEKCGVFGIFGQNFDVSRLAFYGLFSLQHRGQEASGMAVADGRRIKCHKKRGLVTHAYSEEDIQKLEGHIAIGHNLYSTCRKSDETHLQPVVKCDGRLTLVHNGNLPSIQALVDFLEAEGIDTTEKNDSELMTEAIAYFFNQGVKLEEAVRKAYPLFTGCFCLLVMSKDTIVALRDDKGIRPLSIAELEDGYAIASETCAFQTIGAEYIREIEPGEMLVINEEGLSSHQLQEPNPKLDIFEFVYFSRPDSLLMGKSVYQVRQANGVRLAQEAPLNVDMVIPVPDTAIPAAIGYARELNLPYENALVKNKYIHRTFIQPNQRARDLGVKLKLNPLIEVVKGKRVALLDDSIVRGTTSKQIIKALFDAGATEVHFLVGSPPVKYPDFYGINTPKQKKLIAAQKSIPEIEEYLGATSLHYLSLEGLLESTGLGHDSFCLSCFTGEYPIDIKERKEEVVSC